jgi:hypothetical protein
LYVSDIVRYIYIDHKKGNLQFAYQKTILYRDPNRLIHNVSTGNWGIAALSGPGFDTETNHLLVVPDQDWFELDWRPGGSKGTSPVSTGAFAARMVIGAFLSHRSFFQLWYDVLATKTVARKWPSVAALATAGLVRRKNLQVGKAASANPLPAMDSQGGRYNVSRS